MRRRQNAARRAAHRRARRAFGCAAGLDRQGRTLGAASWAIHRQAAVQSRRRRRRLRLIVVAAVSYRRRSRADISIRSPTRCRDVRDAIGRTVRLPHRRRSNFSGNKHLNRDEILARAGVTGLSSLLFFDVTAARARLMSDPRIADATILKLYPDPLADRDHGAPAVRAVADQSAGQRDRRRRHRARALRVARISQAADVRRTWRREARQGAARDA